MKRQIFFLWVCCLIIMMIVFQSCGGKEEKAVPEATVSEEEASETKKDLNSFIYPGAVKAEERHLSGIVNYLTTDDFETVRKYYLNLSGKKVAYGGSVDIF